MKREEIDYSLQIQMKELKANKFCYGMTLEGLLLSSDMSRSAVYIIDREFINIMYLWENDEYGVAIKQSIPLSWQSRKYGNKGVNFLCPECGNKVMNLCNDFGKTFMCEKCLSSAYKYDTTHIESYKLDMQIKNGTVLTIP